MISKADLSAVDGQGREASARCEKRERAASYSAQVRMLTAKSVLFIYIISCEPRAEDLALLYSSLHATLALLRHAQQVDGEHTHTWMHTAH